MKIFCAFLICLLFVVAVVSSSAVPLKLEEKFDVTDHDQKVDDFITGPDVRSVFKHFKRLLTEAVDKVLQDLLSGAFSERQQTGRHFVQNLCEFGVAHSEELKDFPDADKKYKKSHE